MNFSSNSMIKIYVQMNFSNFSQLFPTFMHLSQRVHFAVDIFLSYFDHFGVFIDKIR